MYDDAGSEQGPRGTFETYRAEGEGLYKNGEYRKAIDSFTTALELHQNDQNCLVARSRCYLQLGDTDNALQDAETSLAEDNTFHKGLYQKAEALYCKGEFELALVFYHRGHKLRPELQEFRLGIQKAQEAIDNSVGSPEKVKLTKEGDLSFFDHQNEKKAKPKPTYGSLRPGTRLNQQHRPVKSAQSDKTVKQMLGELYGDKMYLEKLMKETDPNTDSGRSIYELVSEGLLYLDTRTEFWRQQKPMYARRREYPSSNRDRNGKKVPANEYIISELEKIDELQSQGKFNDSIKRADRCLKTVKGYPEDTMSNKDDVMANIYSLKGNALLELQKYKEAKHFHNQDLEIAEANNNEEGKSRALDNLGRVHARMGEFEQAIECWTTKLPMAGNALEKTWLYHEIGRCHLEIGNHTEAKENGEKSQAAAEEAADDMWKLNATVLIAQAEVKLGEHSEALQSFESAMDMAKLQGDSAAETAIKKAINDCNTRIAQQLKEDSERESNKEKEGAGEEKPADSTELEQPAAEPEQLTTEEQTPANDNPVEPSSEQTEERPEAE